MDRIAELLIDCAYSGLTARETSWRPLVASRITLDAANVPHTGNGSLP